VPGADDHLYDLPPEERYRQKTGIEWAWMEAASGPRAYRQSSACGVPGGELHQEPEASRWTTTERAAKYGEAVEEDKAAKEGAFTSRPDLGGSWTDIAVKEEDGWQAAWSESP
jgi:hypothetical protein